MTQTAAVRPLPRRAAAPARPSLRVVAAPVARPTGLGFVGLCLALVVGAMVTMLLINTARAENAFRAGTLRSESAALSAQQSALQEELAIRDNPAWLTQRAQSIGMLPAGSPAYLDARTGSVNGVATLPDPKAALTVLTGKFADQVPPLVREDSRPASRGILAPTSTTVLPQGADSAAPTVVGAPATPAPAPAPATTAKPTTAATAPKPVATKPAATTRPTATKPVATTSAPTPTKKR